MSRVKPILFNTEMVKAILDGRKTVTRRVIKPHYKDNDYGWRIVRYKHNDEIAYVEYYDEWELSTRRMDPPYQPDDILYVRETWAQVSDWCSIDTKSGLPDFYIYKAYWPDDRELPKWRPSIHMPKEAARIWLKVTGVGVERLQDITMKELQREGLLKRGYISQYFEFKTLWDSTIKKSDIDRYGWEANPWVWVIELEQCEKPESEVSESITHD